MRAFIIKAEHRPGSLADLAEALGERGVNITGVAGTGWGDSGAVAVITNDDAGARAALDGARASYEEVEVVAAALEDKPGTLGAAARRLAEHGVNIHALIPTGMRGSQVTVAFAVEDAATARDALGDLAKAGAASI